jgi:hypothetical protein
VGPPAIPGAHPTEGLTAPARLKTARWWSPIDVRGRATSGSPTLAVNTHQGSATFRKRTWYGNTDLVRVVHQSSRVSVSVLSLNTAPDNPEPRIDTREAEA